MRLECVSSGTIRKFEWILRQFKEETRRLSSAKSRVDDAEMAQKTPKLRIREFLRHTLVIHFETFIIFRRIHINVNHTGQRRIRYRFGIADLIKVNVELLQVFKLS